MATITDFIEFMEQYADFISYMESEEQNKLDALLSYNIKKIEQSIASQQAVGKRLEALEKRRMSLQEEAGLGELTFKEILEKVEGGDREKLSELFARFTKSIDHVKYLNSKSIELVKMNLKEINSSGLIEDVPESEAYTANRKKNTAEQGRPVFETKI